MFYSVQGLRQFAADIDNGKLPKKPFDGLYIQAKQHLIERQPALQRFFLRSLLGLAITAAAIVFFPPSFWLRFFIIVLWILFQGVLFLQVYVNALEIDQVLEARVRKKRSLLPDILREFGYKMSGPDLLRLDTDEVLWKEVQDKAWQKMTALGEISGQYDPGDGRPEGIDAIMEYNFWHVMLNEFSMLTDPKYNFDWEAVRRRKGEEIQDSELD